MLIFVEMTNIITHNTFKSWKFTEKWKKNWILFFAWSWSKLRCWRRKFGAFSADGEVRSSFNTGGSWTSPERERMLRNPANGRLVNSGSSSNIWWIAAFISCETGVKRLAPRSVRTVPLAGRLRKKTGTTTANNKTWQCKTGRGAVASALPQKPKQRNLTPLPLPEFFVTEQRKKVKQ